ncbi:DNA polymerase III subunit chi [Pseudomonas yangonensis]|uniref:DNA polymerase III subunit chi n=1 Tax=Pseudomonas yangonensis TaxID=2579922 RepID=UPI00137B3A84|nr:DNA polymerase III subunit chi [Pseudomonas yangonensis]
MDTPKPPQKPAQLLHDLESIRELLGDDSSEPPLLIDSLDPDSIPVLSDIVSAPPGPPPPFHATQAARTSQAPGPTAPAASTAPSASPLRERIEPRLHDSARELQHLNGELRAAAQLILQDVIDDFVPQIEAELKRRLEARLPRLLPPRKP